MEAKNTRRRGVQAVLQMWMRDDEVVNGGLAEPATALLALVEAVYEQMSNDRGTRPRWNAEQWDALTHKLNEMREF